MANKEQESKFNDLKFYFSRCYDGDRYRLLRFCLYPLLPAGLLKESSVGGYLLNELEIKGKISFKKVKVLYDVADLTDEHNAQKLVEKYMKDNNIDKELGETFTSHRRGLFKMLANSTTEELEFVKSTYGSLKVNYTNIWDVVFELEQQVLLTDQDVHVKGFLRLFSDITQALYAEEVSKPEKTCELTSSSTVVGQHTTEASFLQEWPAKTAQEILGMKIKTGKFKKDGGITMYKMTSNPRGMALIINNKTFNKSPERTGTDRDAELLKSLFKNLGFEVEIKENVTHKQFEELLQTYSKIDHKRFDCFILAVLSHGNNAAVITEDEKEMEIKTIWGYFTGDKCPSLSGKPKLFFIQACRGGKKDKGVTNIGRNFAPDFPGRENDELEQLPNECDIFIAYATIPGYISWREERFGSVFVQAITETFKEEVHKRDMVSMSTTINRKVSEVTIITDEGSFKQMSHSDNVLRKDLYFNPGHSMTDK